MPTRTAPSTPRRTSSTLAVPRLLQRRAERRQALQAEKQLQRALAGAFGAGVRADVLAAQHRSAA